MFSIENYKEYTNPYIEGKNFQYKCIVHQKF